MDKDSLPSIIKDDELKALQEFYDVSRLETVKRSPRRTNNAVQDAFDLIGGVPRLAIWADRNPGEFFTKILPRTLQSQMQQEHSGTIQIVTKIPRTALDGEFEDVSSE